jgi:putative spermidine/putrescine transport system permease protein
VSHHQHVVSAVAPATPAVSATVPGSSLPWWMSAPAILLCSVMLLVPLLLTVILSFNTFDADLGPQSGTFTLEHYRAVLLDPYYYEIFWRTFWISGLVTLVCIVVGAPEAYILNRMGKPWRSIMLLVVLAPLMISVVVRAFGWSMLLGQEGLINGVLAAFGLGSYKLLYTETAIVIALVHVMLPFMVIPVWTSLQKLDQGVANAALSLGASPLTAMRRIILPQVMPGILSGSLIVFGLSASSFAIPGLLGGRRLKMMATLVYDEYLHELNWPLGASIALLLLLANLVVMLGWNRMLERRYKKALG